MKCYHPLKAYTLEGGGITFNGSQKGILHDLQLPCGQCIGCKEKRAAGWQVRLSHERQLHDQSCFLTLTYADEFVPDHGLEHRHIQLFLKRLRTDTAARIKYYMCGEYGGQTQRPHYHMCLFGWDYSDDRTYYKKSKKGFDMYESQRLQRHWQLGHATIQALTPETAGYTTGYILEDARTKPIGKTPEYAQMSNGLGAEWLKRYHRDLYPHNFAELNGNKRPLPRYYKERLATMEGYNHVKIEDDAIEAAAKHADDNTPERLMAQEVVAKARQKAKQRHDES